MIIAASVWYQIAIKPSANDLNASYVHTKIASKTEYRTGFMPQHPTSFEVVTTTSTKARRGFKYTINPDTSCVLDFADDHPGEVAIVREKNDDGTFEIPYISTKYGWKPATTVNSISYSKDSQHFGTGFPNGLDKNFSHLTVASSRPDDLFTQVSFKDHPYIGFVRLQNVGKPLEPTIISVKNRDQELVYWVIVDAPV